MIASPSAARLSRLIALVPWLISHDGVTISEAAAHFGVTDKQLVDDLWLLVCSGLPGHMPDQLVDIQFWDDDGRIDVIDPQTLTRPLRLSPDEALCLLVGLRLLAQVPGDHDRDALASVTAKLEAAAGSAAAGVERVAVDIELSPTMSAVVEAALAGHRALELVYAGATRDEMSERVVDPMRVLVVEGRSYLEAWCRSAGAVRIFRLDRIQSATVLEEESSPPVEAAPSVLGADGFRLEGARLVVDLDPRGRWALEAHPSRVVEVRPDGSMRAEFVVGDPAWAVRMVLALGGAGVVVEPADLAARVAAEARSALNRYY